MYANFYHVYSEKYLSIKCVTVEPDFDSTIIYLRNEKTIEIDAEYFHSVTERKPEPKYLIVTHRKYAKLSDEIY